MRDSGKEQRDRTPGAERPSLPQNWDFGRDLAVLVGCEVEPLVSWFRARGQVRLIVVVEEEGPALPAGVLRAGSEGDLVLAILQLSGALPAHVSVLRTADPWATPERHREVARWLGGALFSRKIQAETVALSGKTWLLQGVGNLAPLAGMPSVDALRGAFRGRPAVLVSPGPSLARNVDRLAELSDRALVVAGSHALGALQRAGVVPHVLILADPGDLVRHLEGFDLAALETLVVAATCRREALELEVPRAFSFAGNGGLDGWIFDALGEDAALPTGGSVACSALSLALLLECDPIVFVGQDLSFSEEGYYAPGTVDDDAKVVLDEEGRFFLEKPEGTYEHGVPLEDGGLRFTKDREVVRLPGYHGGTVPSSHMFQAFHTWFEAVALTVQDRVRLLNCTEGGVRIRGMEQLPLADAVRDWLPVEDPVGRVLDRVLERHAPQVRRGRMEQHVRAMIAALDPCIELARRCGTLAAEGLQDPAKLDELGRAEKRLTQALKPVQLFSLVAQDEIVAAQERARTATDLSENLAAARSLFDVVERSAQLLREPLSLALGELESQ